MFMFNSTVSKVILWFIVSLIQVQTCYWNNRCSYGLFGSKTPYDTVRGDIRDYPFIENCEVVSIWTLNRHGNRNPGSGVTFGMKDAVSLKDEIIASHESGYSKLCSQDIENFRKWSWNETLEVSQSYLTATGYEELYGLGKRIQEKYFDLLIGNTEDFYFRSTNEQRTITSSMAFVQGITDGLNINVTVDKPLDEDDVIKPYDHCDRYQSIVKDGQHLSDQLQAYFESTEYIGVLNAVQDRLGLKTTLDTSKLMSIYELCRFYRSWTETLQSPWCAAFSNQDLMVLEYHDDIRHYYRNGYGSWVNMNLGRIVLKDLYDTFDAAVNGQVKKLVSYFTHDTMMEMALSAMGLYQGDQPLQSSLRDPHRVWRTSLVGAFSSNFIAVLNSCNNEAPPYKVQLFFNEKETVLCPTEGCSWLEFKKKFQDFTNANLDFCSINHNNRSRPVWRPKSRTALNKIRELV